MLYVVLVLVVGGFGYFIYRGIKKNNTPSSGGTSSGGGVIPPRNDGTRPNKN